MQISFVEDARASALAKKITKHLETDPEIGICARFNDVYLTSAYQPILRYQNGEVIEYGYEALLRSVDDTDGFSPFHFINGLDCEDRRLFDRVARALHIRNFLLMRNSNSKLFLNTDPINYVDPQYQMNAMALMISRALEAGLDLDNLVVELMETESGNDNVLQDCVEGLRAHGAAIAIDDYGVEHSCISRVKLMLPDIVKFDRSWLTRGRQSEANRQDLYTHVKELRDLDIKILIEGVEFEEDLVMVENIKPDFVQGYWYGKPKKITTYITDILPLQVSGTGVFNIKYG